MVRPGGRRGDDDLGPVCDRTGRVHGHIVTASFRGTLGSSTQPSAGDRAFEGDKGFGEEHDRVQTLYIKGEAEEGGDDASNGGDDDEDEGEDAGDEEQPVPMAPLACASGFDGRPHHGKGKGLTWSFMSMMRKISRFRNKRPDVSREVSAPTQRRKKVKSSDWEQTGPADGGPVDLELILSYGGYIAGSIWRG
ncbi:hypothetical protein M9H77_31557 [Catharanthus roseus]|uniref:Uncharacterized protein n=1 Tax=Catharanthus roseus TaxID=4058 RepID=A0ACC0A0D9_CATRO|nr:hypothetical protein M9H77_31557 [Catharanthus roseus]